MTVQCHIDPQQRIVILPWGIVVVVKVEYSSNMFLKETFIRTYYVLRVCVRQAGRQARQARQAARQVGRRPGR